MSKFLGKTRAGWTPFKGSALLSTKQGLTVKAVNHDIAEKVLVNRKKAHRRSLYRRS